MKRALWVMIVAGIAIAASPRRVMADVQAQSAKVPASSGSIEDHVINRAMADKAGDSKGPLTLSPEADNGMRMSHVVLALGGVIGLIFLLRAGAKHVFPGAVPHRASGILKVLSRCTISPRQHLLLIQVGKRLVVVGDCGAQLNPLCEIRDSEEVSSMLAQMRDESISAAGKFDTLFGRARKGFGGSQSTDEMTDSLPSSVADTSAPDEPVSQEDEQFDPTHEISDSSMQATQKELAGLSDKVRDLARQLGRV